MIDMFYI